MARGVKGLGMGIVDGVTGVVTKPIEGARQGGAGGFVKVRKSTQNLLRSPNSLKVKQFAQHESFWWIWNVSYKKVLHSRIDYIMIKRHAALICHVIQGLGKGLVGVVTRPVSGAVDLASSTLQSVKHVAGADRSTDPLRYGTLVVR